MTRLERLEKELAAAIPHYKTLRIAGRGGKLTDSEVEAIDRLAEEYDVSPVFLPDKQWKEYKYGRKAIRLVVDKAELAAKEAEVNDIE